MQNPDCGHRMYYNRNINRDPLAQRIHGAFPIIGNPNNTNKISSPPKFDPEGLGIWKRAMSFRRNLYLEIPDDPISVEIGIPGSGELRGELMIFYDECGPNGIPRSFGGFIENGERIARIRRSRKNAKGARHVPMSPERRLGHSSSLDGTSRYDESVQ